MAGQISNSKKNKESFAILIKHYIFAPEKWRDLTACNHNKKCSNEFIQGTCGARRLLTKQPRWRLFFIFLKEEIYELFIYIGVSLRGASG